MGFADAQPILRAATCYPSATALQTPSRLGMRCEIVLPKWICNHDRTEARAVGHVFREDRGAPRLGGGGKQHAIPIRKTALRSFIQCRAPRGPNSRRYRSRRVTGPLAPPRLSDQASTCQSRLRRIRPRPATLGTIEIGGGLDDPYGEFAFAAFAGINRIDQNVGVKREAISAHAGRRASSGADRRKFPAWCAPI